MVRGMRAEGRRGAMGGKREGRQGWLGSVMVRACYAMGGGHDGM